MTSKTSLQDLKEAISIEVELTMRRVLQEFFTKQELPSSNNPQSENVDEDDRSSELDLLPAPNLNQAVEWSDDDIEEIGPGTINIHSSN